MKSRILQRARKNELEKQTPNPVKIQQYVLAIFLCDFEIDGDGPCKKMFTDI